jgi:hypothetical protein
MSMDINSISSLYSSPAIGGVGTTDSTSNGASVDATSSAVSVDLSKPGQLFSQLQNLAQTDPPKFKEVTAEIASQLKDAASTHTGKQADFLNALAGRFDAASQSGNVSDLKPPQAQAQAQASGHHHHHHHAQGAGSAQSSSSSQAGADSVLQLVQGIISNALGSVSTG